ncbi:helix-turn-helix domain-containing protein [Actinosynnema sp. NPDC053489]|uniref:helix-turn-helix domain-containing protein n=1 Tax=Actinosynnema sp. NPDC053489 TaxID=3363916 RepID=UPI0037C92DCB
MTGLAAPSPSSSFGLCLMRYRTGAGLSQAELARASGMSVRALRELERGRAAAAQERSVELLAEALGLTGDERESFVLLAKEGRRRTTRTGNRTMLYALPVVPRLIGREEELERLAAEAGTGGVVVVAGPPGVGKTSLAVAAAGALAHLFPDGCLALDLRGVDDRPIPATTALERMLTALGVAPMRIPASEEGRASLYRTLLRDRRVLVVLDNAADEAQVRPLLGTGERSLTIVTCRRALAGLESARWLPLEVLPTRGALDLLASIVGEDTVREQATAAHDLVSLCGNLPLAVRIAGNRLATRRSWSIAYLVRQLRDEHRRLDSLSAGDLHLRSAFEVSLRRLSPEAQRVFRRLALIPGAHFDDDLAAVAADVPPERIGAHLDELVEASLLTTSGPRRLQFHDLLRLFAGERLAAEEPEHVRAELRDGLYSHVLAKASAAGDLFYPHVREAPADNPFRSQDEAKEWLGEQATNWVAVQREAAELGWHRRVLDCTWALHRYAHGREPEQRWDEIFGIGLRAARALGDRVAEVDMLTQMGSAQHWTAAETERAIVSFGEAIALAEEIGYHRGITIASASLGQTMFSTGRTEEGMAHSLRAYEMSMGYDFFDVKLWMALGLGTVLNIAGRFEEALDVHRTLLAEVGVRREQTNPETAKKVTTLLLALIADGLAGLGQWLEAARHYHQAGKLAFDKQPGYRSEAELALAEGIAWREAGQYEHARTRLLFALDLSDGPASRVERERAEAELARLPD